MRVSLLLSMAVLLANGRCLPAQDVGPQPAAGFRDEAEATMPPAPGLEKGKDATPGAATVGATELASPAPTAPATETAAGMTNVLRDPFWPIGYWPEPPQEEEVGPTEEAPIVVKPPPPVEWPKLTLKGITRGPDGKYLAIIAGVGIVEAGDAVRLTKGGVVYRWQINEVTSKGVSQTRLDATPQE